MDINIIPVMVKDDGSVSVHIAPTDDPLKPGYIRFSSTELPSRDEVLRHLPEEFLVNNNPADITVKTIPQTSEDKAYIVVSGKEDVFAPPRIDQTSRWVSQSDIKFGPLPQNVKNANTLQGLYTESMERDNRGAMFAGVFTAKALGITEEIPNNLPVVCERISQSPEVSALFLNPRMDLRALMRPVLDLGEATIEAMQPVVEKIKTAPISRRLFTSAAVKLVTFLSRPGLVGNNPDGLAARARAKIAAAVARGADPVPKPA